MDSGSPFHKAGWIALHQGPLELFKRTWRFLKKHKLRGAWIYLSRANTYKFWLKKESDSVREKLNSASGDIASFNSKPVFSIIMPVWNTKMDYLEKTIASVIGQAYPYWELCIADDASIEPHISKVLGKYVEIDIRIKFLRLAEHGGIVKAANAALGLATGEFTAFLDHDDILAPHALLEIAKLINTRTDIDLIYSDEDRLIGNERVEPFFKPDWSPDLLLSMNYIGHLLVVRRNLIENTGGFREGTDGSQDYDLILRLTELSHRIAHIPQVLYHWRMTPGSVSNVAGTMNEAVEAGRKAIEAALVRRGIEGQVTAIDNGRYRVKYRIKGSPLISIIIPMRDKVDLLRKCLKSILEKSTYKNYEIIIVDNKSIEEETKDFLRELSARDGRCRVISFDEAFNYSRINNFAVQHAAGDYLLFLNNDTEVITEDWLEEMLSDAQRQEVGAVGAKLLFSDNRIQHGGVVLGIGGIASHAFYYDLAGESGYMDFAAVRRNCSAVTAACLMMRKSVFDEIGGFDENLDVVFNDVDLCLKVIYKGYYIVWNPYVVLYHYESLSRGYNLPEHNIQYFCNKWRSMIEQGDRFYNPNLTLNYCDFRIKL